MRPSRTSVRLLCLPMEMCIGDSNNGQNYKLILSASPSFARAHLTKGQFINPIDAPMFCMLMRKHLSGGRLMEISQLNGDRVLLLRFEAQDELGVDVYKRQV